MLNNESLTKLSELIRTKSVSVVEVVKAHLDQIRILNPKLNAIVTISPDVLDRAREVDDLIRRGEIGPLLGVPITIKDTIETKGLLTTSGSRLRAAIVPSADAPAVARLKAAGAIVLGKTNTAEMAMEYTADNLVFGRTNHPLDETLTPGGSSGGEAVAIATHMSPGGLGSDLAGSVRIPSHFCGIVGLKPTTGKVPGEGQFPPSTGPYSLGAVIGPMARSVADVRCLYRALTNETGAEVHPLKGIRVGWYTNDHIAPVTDETVQAVANATAALKDAGLEVEECVPPHIDRANDLWLRIFGRASVVQLRKVYEGKESEAGSFVKWRLGSAGESPKLDDYVSDWMERDKYRAELIAWMERIPILICPVGAVPAYSHQAEKVTVKGKTMGLFKAFSYAQAFNLFDLPVVTVPAGKSEGGLPIGVQIVGRPFEEDLVMRVAEVVERSC